MIRAVSSLASQSGRLTLNHALGASSTSKLRGFVHMSASKDAARDAEAAQGLASKACQSCKGGLPSLTRDEVTALMSELPDWTFREDQELPPRIERGFRTKNFQKALDLVNLIGHVAEEEGHHPDISIHSYNKVLITLTTHSVKNLTENDMILAAKIDGLPIMELLSIKKKYSDD